MSEEIYITSEFKTKLSELNCGTGEDYIVVYKREDKKIYFQYGTCKLHITKAEFEEVQVKAED